MNLNNKQKKILRVIIGIFILMLIIPPFQATDYYKPGVIHNLGYNFILDGASHNNVEGTVNIGLLCVQWLGAAVVGAGLIFAAKD